MPYMPYMPHAAIFNVQVCQRRVPGVAKLFHALVFYVSFSQPDQVGLLDFRDSFTFTFSSPSVLLPWPGAGLLGTWPQCSCCGTLIFIPIPPVAFEAAPRMHDQADRSALSGKYYGCGPWMWSRIQWDSQSQIALCLISPHYTLHHIAKCNRRSLQIRCTLLRLHSFEAPHKFMHCQCFAYDWLYRFPAVSRRWQASIGEIYWVIWVWFQETILHLWSVHDPTFQLWGTFPETQRSD